MPTGRECLDMILGSTTTDLMSYFMCINIHAAKFVFEADDNDVMFSEEIIRPVLAAMKVGLGFQVMDTVCLEIHERSMTLCQALTNVEDDVRCWLYSARQFTLFLSLSFKNTPCCTP